MADLDYKALFDEMVDDLVEQRGVEDACYYMSYLVSIQDLHEKLHFEIETIANVLFEMMDEEERNNRAKVSEILWLAQKARDKGYYDPKYKIVGVSENA